MWERKNKLRETADRETRLRIKKAFEYIQFQFSLFKQVDKIDIKIMCRRKPHKQLNYKEKNIKDYGRGQMHWFWLCNHSVGHLKLLLIIGVDNSLDMWHVWLDVECNQIANKKSKRGRLCKQTFWGNLLLNNVLYVRKKRVCWKRLNVYNAVGLMCVCRGSRSSSTKSAMFLL